MKIERYEGMLIIRNRIIPFKGFKSMMLFSILFTKPKAILDDLTLNHEAIHSVQQKEMLWIFFYLWYLIEWLVKIFIYGWDAYDNISFEREAYANEEDFEYLEKRKFWAWLKYV